MRCHRESLLALLALTGMGCVGVSPHGSPASVTDTEILAYQHGIRAGCTDQALSRGKSRPEADQACDCVVDTLKRALTREEWQRATYDSQKRMDSDESAVLAPHADAVRSCRAAP